MQGTRMEMDWQLVYAAETSLGQVSVTAYVDAKSDEAMLNPEHPATLVPIADALTEARLGIVYALAYQCSQDIY